MSAWLWAQKFTPLWLNIERCTLVLNLAIEQIFCHWVFNVKNVKDIYKSSDRKDLSALSSFFVRWACRREVRCMCQQCQPIRKTTRKYISDWAWYIWRTGPETCCCQVDQSYWEKGGLGVLIIVMLCWHTVALDAIHNLQNKHIVRGASGGRRLLGERREYIC